MCRSSQGLRLSLGASCESSVCSLKFGSTRFGFGEVLDKGLFLKLKRVILEISFEIEEISSLPDVTLKVFIPWYTMKICSTLNTVIFSRSS